MDAYLPLLHDVSKATGLVNPKTTYKQFISSIHFQIKAQARDALIADDDLRLQYFKRNKTKLSVESIKIISDLRRRKTGKFVVFKLLKDRAVWFDMQDRIYIVHDLLDPFEVMLDDVPCMVEASILPFFSGILYDGFVKPYNIHIGPNIHKSLREKYRLAKEQGQIITSL